MNISTRQGASLVGIGNVVHATRRITLLCLLVLSALVVLTSSHSAHAEKTQRWTRTLSSGEGARFEFEKPLRRMTMDFFVTTRVKNDDDVGKHVFFTCQIERKNEKAEWEPVTWSTLPEQDRCLKSVPIDKGTYRLAIENVDTVFGKAPTADFTIVLTQGESG